MGEIVGKIDNLKNIKTYFDLSIDVNSEKDIEDNFETKIKITHKKCGHTKEAKLKTLFSKVIGKYNMDFYSYLKDYFDDNLEMKCSHCLELAKQQYLCDKLKNIDFIKKHFVFQESIETIEDMNKFFDEKLEFVHKSCNNTVSLKLKELVGDNISGIRMQAYDYLRDYIDDMIDLKCPHCMQKAKNEYFNEILKERFDNQYRLKGNFEGLSKYVTIEHKWCKTSLKRIGQSITSVETMPICTTCNKVLTRMEKIKQSKMLKMGDRYKFPKDIKNVYTFKEYLDKDMEVTHKKCKRKFSIKLNDFFKAKMSHAEGVLNYLDDADDVICPHCMQDAKNKYFSEILKNKSNGTFELVGDYTTANAKVKIKHTLCSETMEVWAMTIISGDKIVKCQHCSRLLTSSERKKVENLKSMKEHFEIPDVLDEPYLFKKYADKEVEIVHKKCNRKFTVVLGKLNEVAIDKNGYLKDILENVEDGKCPHCLQDAKNKYFSDFLDSIYNGEYILHGNYATTKDEVSVKHTPCGNVVTVTASIITRQRRTVTSLCKCGEDSLHKVVQEKKNKKFQQELIERKCEDFEAKGNYIDLDTPMLIHHKTCGYEFEVTPENFFKRINKCPNCTDDSRVIYKSQEEKNEVFQQRLDKKVQGFRLVGDYNNKTDVITLYHEGCNKEFNIVYDSFVNSNYKCPRCETKKYKFSKDISLKEKIKYFEEDLNNEYKILTGFTTVLDEVTLRHKRCGKSFKTTLNSALMHRNKSKICPHCEVEKRKNNFLKKMIDKFGENSYKLVGEYVNGDTSVLFEHMPCKKLFLSTPNKLLSKVVEYCPKCKTERLRVHKGKKFKLKLLEKHGNEYSMSTEYKRHDKKILFTHKKCGTKFWLTPSEILKKDVPCKKCNAVNRYIPLEEVNERISKNTGGSFSIVGEYMGTEQDTLIKCNDCNHVIEARPVEFFRKKLCPNCEIEKRKKIFLDKLEKKFKNAFVLVGDYVSIEKPTYFKHRACNYKFKISPKQLLEKKIDMCPKCKEERTKSYYLEKSKREFEKKLKNKYKDEYTPLSEYVDYKTHMKFRHEKCGEIITRTPYRMISKDIPCVCER